jgi:hypothetical protein
MWNYLERILGKSSQYYENIMRSRDPKVKMTQTSIDQASGIIKPLILESFEFELTQNLPSALAAPKNSKQIEIPFYGTIAHPKYALYLFIDISKFSKDPSNMGLLVGEKTSDNTFKNKSLPSLPIWEELIHYDSAAHHQIVELSNQQPWGLYKAAKHHLVGSSKHDVVSGYPQWIVNDIDFRKIKDMEFLFQMELPNSEQMIYFFKDVRKFHTEFFIQKL